MSTVLTKQIDEIGYGSSLIESRLDVEDPSDVPFRVVDLWKSFGEASVLTGINLDIHHGEFISVVGRSGCGKSTLLRLLAGLETPTKGKVMVYGNELKGINRNVRIVFQDPRLMPWMKVRENVALGLNGNWKPRADAALTDVGLDTRGGDWPAILSGGQRQRVSLARALVNEPDFMLLDEPHGALDALTKLDMQNLLERLWMKRKFAALLITHDVDEAIALADRVILIQDGHITLNVTVDLPRPRNRTEPRYQEIRGDILHCVSGGIIGPGASI